MSRRLALLIFGSISVLVLTATPTLAAKPPTEAMYANGTTVYMVAPPTLATAGSNVPDDLYLAVYPIDPTGTNLGPLAIGTNGYVPQCDPCFHPGVPLPFAYHDHVISGTPGLGVNGTAGSFNPFWHVFVVMYNPARFIGQSFTPVRSTAELDAGESNGMFLPINAAGPNPYEVDTGIVFLCDIVAQHA